MHRVTDPFRHLHMPADLACQFLAVFARTEYALKATPAYVHGDANRADASWDSFANAIDSAFSAVPQSNTQFWEAVNYLLGHPPRKQTLRGGLLIFKDQVVDRKQSRAQQALLMVRTVRNNLFHGGKHYPDGEQDLGRNERLVRSSLNVLLAVVSLDAAVQTQYER